jgi:hypothetical protein
MTGSPKKTGAGSERGAVPTAQAVFKDKLCKDATGFKKIRQPDRIIMTVLFLS